MISLFQVEAFFRDIKSSILITLITVTQSQFVPRRARSTNEGFIAMTIVPAANVTESVKI